MRERMSALLQDRIAAFNAHDADAFVALYAPDVIFRDIATAVPAHGRDVVRDWVETYFRAFHDAKMESKVIAIDGEVLVYEWRATGTHDEDFMGFPATGRFLEVDGCSIARIGDDDLVHAEKNYWDVAGMLQQMGALPVATQEIPHASRVEGENITAA
jgi:steroid delta-isomerase-like uncharacterized protein